jgi:hypothetical protein
MIFASAAAGIVQDDPVTTTFSVEDAPELPAEVAREDDPVASPAGGTVGTPAEPRPHDSPEQPRGAAVVPPVRRPGPSLG